MMQVEQIDSEDILYKIYNDSIKEGFTSYFLFSNTYDERYKIIMNNYNPQIEKSIYFIDLFEMPAICSKDKFNFTVAPTLIYTKKGKSKTIQNHSAIIRILNDLD